MGNFSLSPSQIVARWYGITLAVACFGWPLILGMPFGWLRVTWLAIAVFCVAVSIVLAQKFAEKSVVPVLSADAPPWFLILAATLFIAYATRFPTTFFSDDEAIVIPPLVVAYRLAALLTWPGLTATILTLGALVLWRYKKVSSWHLWAVFLITLLSTSFIGFFYHNAETLLVRYPPMMNLTQLVSTIIGQGEPLLMRLANAGWTFVLALVVWYLLPTWKPHARLALGLVACLTPLGWSYRILLYQSSGEIVLALAIILLLSQLLSGRDGIALYIGMTFSLWILYRPTAFALATATVLALLLLRRKRDALEVGAIALPIGILWCAVYILGAFQYDFLSSSSTRSFVVARPMFETLKALPEQLSVPGLLVLIIGSICIFWKRPHDRWLLALAWLFSVSYTVLHQLLTIDVWYGYGRFNALLIVPLAVVTSSMVMWAKEKKCTWLTLPLIAILVAVTPWNFVSFMQGYRSDAYQHRMERTVTGGAIPTPLPAATEELLSHVDTMIILTPTVTYLDLFIARGMITADQRTSIVDRSRAWTPSDTSRPVLVQAPMKGRTYRTNIPETLENRLLEAAEWAKAQPNVYERVYGEERVIIVP